VSPTPPSAAQSVICRFRCHAIVNTFAAGCRPLLLTFTNRCPVTLVSAVHSDEKVNSDGQNANWNIHVILKRTNEHKVVMMNLGG
jgi:hypothetical protein